jgi:hypothetical protein
MTIQPTPEAAGQEIQPTSIQPTPKPGGGSAEGLQGGQETQGHCGQGTIIPWRKHGDLEQCEGSAGLGSGTKAALSPSTVPPAKG